jgi:hypothetical protein
MPKPDVHLSDHEILLAADGELSPREAGRARAHLAACWSCRGRMAEIEQTIAAFARAYREALDPTQISASGPRALLRARLAQEASQSKAEWWRVWWHPSEAVRRAAMMAAVLLAAVTAGSFVVLRSIPSPPQSGAAELERDVLPDRALTPGVTRAVNTIGEVCTMAREEVVKEVSTSLRQEVFRRYGIVNPSANDYEIDYLIAPGLGGVGAIRNLWPEPYKSRTWNAQVKDELEERLHEMVCQGKLDLSIAQRDIAADWIAAYKKYFHSNRPLGPDASQSGAFSERHPAEDGQDANLEGIQSGGSENRVQAVGVNYD